MCLRSGSECLRSGSEHVYERPRLFLLNMCCLLPPLSVWIVAAVAGVATRMSASLDEAAAEKAKAREALIGSAGMEQLLKMVAQDDGEVRRTRKHEVQYRSH